MRLIPVDEILVYSHTLIPPKFIDEIVAGVALDFLPGFL